MFTLAKRICITLFSLSIIFVFSTASASEEIRFNWAFLQDTEKGLQELDFSSPAKVSKGATLQIYISPSPNTYVYIFLLDSSNYISPIFPGSVYYYDTNPPGKAIRIPAGKDRFAVVPPAGQEKFYLLASSKRLTILEELLEECIRKPDDINSQASLFKEIRHLRRKNSKLTQVTEKGMPVSGSTRYLGATRGAPKHETFNVTQVVAQSFYSRILRLNHD